MKKIKLALFALGMLITGVTNAQHTDTNTQVFGKQGNATLGSLNKAVRVIDNKGTIKYLQVSNGLTLFTDKTPAGGIVTTWQLGGTLGTNTFIQADTNKEFALDGIALATSTAVAATQAVNRNSHNAANKAGFTVLIRDEQTGAIQKIMLTDLLNVESEVFDITIAGSTPTPPLLSMTKADITSATVGRELSFKTKISKISVYRNGAKLRALKDYKLVTPATGNQKVYLVPDTTNPDTNVNYWDIYDGDVIEIHAFK